MDSRLSKTFLFLFLCCLISLAGCHSHRASRSATSSSQLYPGPKRFITPQSEHINYFRWPAAAKISSHYGTRGGRFHSGLDIDGEKGDPIYAAAKGKIIFSGRLGAYGKTIIIRHPNGLLSVYAHNKKNKVKAGKKVKQGQKIGLIGQTGRATGSHLHFEIRNHEGTFDPLQLLP